MAAQSVSNDPSVLNQTGEQPRKQRSSEVPQPLAATDPTDAVRMFLARLRELGHRAYLEGSLIHLDIPGAVIRVETLKSAPPCPEYHVHVTLAAPTLACPFLYCWCGDNLEEYAFPAEAVATWFESVYPVFRTALSSPSALSGVVLETEGRTWGIFSGPVESCENWRYQTDLAGVEGLSRGCGSPLLAISQGDSAQALSQELVHWLIWKAPSHHDPGSRPFDLQLDGKPLCGPLGGVLEAHLREHFPEPTAGSLRQLILLHCQSHWTPIDPEAAPRIASRYYLEQAGRLLRANSLTQGFAGILYGLELDPSNPLIPEILNEWTHRAPAQPEASTAIAAEVPLSSLYVAAYAAMRQCHTTEALELLRRANARVPLDPRALHSHWPSLAKQYAEVSLPDVEPTRGRCIAEDRWPASRPPPPQFSAALAELAQVPFRRSDWRAASRRILGKLGRSPEKGIVQAMAHPADSPPQIPSENWHFLAECAGTFLLAQRVVLEGLDSQPGRTLVGLLDGPTDWVTTAGVLGLTEAALARPTAEFGVIEEISSRLFSRDTPHWTGRFTLPAAWLLLKLPNVDRALRTTLENLLDRELQLALRNG